jgi:mono/diheme cytochrome c family protein
MLLVGAIALSGCPNESDIDPMMRQEKMKPYWANDFYADGRSMRLPPANAVPRERSLAALTPPPVTAALVERGRERFDIHCAVCHGFAGDGESVVASKMSLRAPPSFHEEKYRPYTVAQIFEVVTQGYGYMPKYDSEISVSDRWAISNYVKALQLSQRASVDDVPADKRGDLDKPAKPPASEGGAEHHGGEHHGGEHHGEKSQHSENKE